MNIEWVSVFFLYAFSLPIAYAGWVAYRTHFPKYIILHDLYRDSIPRVELTQGDSYGEDNEFELPRAA